MRVSGFSIVRDAVKLGYPFLESIQSLLPLVDEFVIAVGDCSDDTRQRIIDLDSEKIRILDTVWNPTACSGGEVMAQQTNLALDACHGDWCIYIQADEVIHEQDLGVIRKSMERWLLDSRVDGLTFEYLHFMGDYDIVNPLAYRRQTRIVRNRPQIRSVGDACGFGIENRKLTTKRSGARMFHYGYVRPPEQMARKSVQFAYLYRGEDNRTAPPPDLDRAAPWDWDLRICNYYRGNHPQVMQEAINARTWHVKFVPVPWYRNRHWWNRFLQKNFASLFRLFVKPPMWHADVANEPSTTSDACRVA
jgi:glycosyltransferase involved in cell wall biosynthesis